MSVKPALGGGGGRGGKIKNLGPALATQQVLIMPGLCITN